MPGLAGLLRSLGFRPRMTGSGAGGGEAGAGEAVAFALTAGESGAAGAGEDAARPERLVAVRVRGRRILSGSRLDLVIGGEGATAAEAAGRLSDFAGGRPLVGYRPSRALALLKPEAGPGGGFPRGRLIDVAELYVQGTGADPGLEGILAGLGLPATFPPGPLGEAVSVALAWLKLGGESPPPAGAGRVAIIPRRGPPTACS